MRPLIRAQHLIPFPAAWQKSGSLSPLCCLLGSALSMRLWSSSTETSGSEGSEGVLRAQSRQPQPPVAIREGWISNQRSELEWSWALVAEQKCCCPQRHHLCDLWPQQHCSQSGLKGKERRWCKKTPPKPYLFILVSGPWASNPGAVTATATRQGPKAAAVAHQHLFLQLCCWSQ